MTFLKGKTSRRKNKWAWSKHSPGALEDPLDGFIIVIKK